jgi:hypothetical protein
LADASLDVRKGTVGDILKTYRFVIPDYQREYAWEYEECDALWDDIVELSRGSDTKDEDETEQEHFLGTIVVSKAGGNVWKIVDGQQRITSFFLMLRMFYKKLEEMSDNLTAVAKLKQDIASCIWGVDRRSGAVSDRSKARIVSKAVSDKQQEILANILCTGEADSKAQDNYSRNYLHFRKRCDELVKASFRWDDICDAILNQCVVLPVICGSEDTAFTIFHTLNDRGRPLADSDIFRARIYGFLRKETIEQREAFNDAWEQLSDTCRSVSFYLKDFTIDDVFHYYMHVLRASKGIMDSTVLGLRKFYTSDKCANLKAPSLMDDITALANFWRHVYDGSSPDKDEGYSISLRARKYLHCFSFYPNYLWRLVVSVFFIKHMRTSSDGQFCFFLEKLLAFMCWAYVEKRGVGLRGEVVKLCVEVWNSGTLDITNHIPKDEMLSECSKPSSKLDKIFLLLHAYLNKKQKTLLPPSTIEHILPKKWKSANYKGWSHENAEASLELFGNKVLIEKPLNIQAGNGFFAEKQKKYKDSAIADVLDLSKQKTDDEGNWLKADIDARDRKFIRLLTKFFKGEESIPA